MLLILLLLLLLLAAVCHMLDPCGPLCSATTGFTCMASLELGSYCGSICGDGLRVGDEQCDDGNVNSGDGCSFNCFVEPGYACAPDKTRDFVDTCHCIAPNGQCKPVCVPAINCGGQGSCSPLGACRCDPSYFGKNCAVIQSPESSIQFFVPTSGLNLTGSVSGYSKVSIPNGTVQQGNYMEIDVYPASVQSVTSLGLYSRSKLFDFRPYWLNLSSAFTVSLPFDPKKVTVSSNYLGIYVFNVDSGKWEHAILNSQTHDVVDNSSFVVTTQVARMGQYMVLEDTTLAPTNTTVSADPPAKVSWIVWPLGVIAIVLLAISGFILGHQYVQTRSREKVKPKDVIAPFDWPPRVKITQNLEVDTMFMGV